MLICSEKSDLYGSCPGCYGQKNLTRTPYPQQALIFKMNKNSILKKSSLFQNTNEMVLNFNLNPSNE